MDPIAMLTAEHREILKVLEALDQYAQGLGRVWRASDLRGFVSWLSGFVDGCHFGKEEDVLFEALRARGEPATAGPLAVLEHEHEQGRGLIELLGDFAERSSWSEADLTRIRTLAQATVRLLRGHIEKEDSLLLPLAQRLLPEAQRRPLAERFERYEQEETGHGEHLRLRHLAEALLERYRPSSAAMDGLGC